MLNFETKFCSEPVAGRNEGPGPLINLAVFILTAVALLSSTLPVSAQAPVEEISIERALEMFYQNNYDLLISRYEIEKSYADYVGTKLFPNPTLSVNKTGMDLNNHLTNNENTQDTIRLDQLIELGGKRGLRQNAAAETLEAARLTHRDTARTLLIGFYTLYFNLYQDSLSRDLALQEIGRFGRILDIAGKRHNAGFLSLNDYTKLKLSAIDLENSLTSVENQLRNNSESFALLLGNPGPLLPVKMAPLTAFDTVSENEMLEIAYKNRYDLLSLERQIGAAGHNLALAKAMRIPDVTLGVEWERFYPNYDPGLGVGLSLPLPLFNRNQGEILRKTAEQKQLEIQMVKVKRLIVAEIRQAINNYATSVRIFQSYQTRKPEMDELLMRTEKSFALGGITVLELLDTQKTYREFNVKYNQALAQSNLSRELIKLYTGTIK
ncbi:MAG TPA: TolC family protein [Syntrophales bacterium]|nr:TolC family protein [Syntrophales bacterium]